MITNLDTLLAALCKDAERADTAPLRRLVAALRPRSGNVEDATQRLRLLTQVLRDQPDLAAGLRDYLTRVVSTRKLGRLVTDFGILGNQGFLSEFWQRLNHKWLPPRIDDGQLVDVLGQVFDHRGDQRWVAAVDDGTWDALLQALGYSWRNAQDFHRAMLCDLIDAAQVLSYRIAAIGIDPELVRNHPAIEEFESPFLRQNAELVRFAEAMQEWLNDRSAAREDTRHIGILLDQCEEIAEKVRRRASRQGVSVALTRLLLRLRQCIARQRLLLAVLDPGSAEAARMSGIALFKQLVAANSAKWSLRDLFDSNTELLALQVTERSSRRGEHYVTRDAAEWKEMFRSAAGAGVIIGFMALFKLLLAKWPLAPFGMAFVFSMNYGFGFMLIHVLHFTVATKQPAMTATSIAAAIDRGAHQLHELAELVVCVIRTQLVAVIGNVLLAMPVAGFIAWWWARWFGVPLADHAKAVHLLTDLSPIDSLAVLHAGIAGVCLFLSGLIAGYYDNKAAFNDIAARLYQLRWLRRLLGERATRRFTLYIGDNLGALAGNFFFGVMLGSMGTLGFIFGLPLDIRHVTFASANFAFALVSLDYQLTPYQWAMSLLGIALIGITNLAVSFALALAVALRSRRVSFGRGRELALLLLKRLWFTPRDFFLPPS